MRPLEVVPTPISNIQAAPCCKHVGSSLSSSFAQSTSKPRTTMNELTPTGQAENVGASGTKVGKFLANRGVIIIKELKDIGTLKCEYGEKIHAETLILATAKSSTNIQAKTFGVRLESIKD